MRAVALGALSLHHRRVLALRRLDLSARIGAVAGVAQKTLLGHQHARHIAGMHLVAAQALAVLEKFVIGTAFGGLHQFSVAFAAHSGIVSGIGQQFGLLAAVGCVTFETLAFQYRRMRIGFQEPGLGFVVAAETDRTRIGFEHTVKIGAMGVMTFAAGAFNKRSMRLEGFLFLQNPLVAIQANHRFPGGQQFGLGAGMPHMAGQAAFCLGYRLVGAGYRGLPVGMTGVTQVIARTHEQNGILGSMGPMALQAFALLKRLVLHRASTRNIGRLMALQAQFGAFFYRGIFLIRPRRGVACAATGFHQRFMHAGFQKFGLQGSMRIVTAGTI